MESTSLLRHHRLKLAPVPDRDRSLCRKCISEVLSHEAGVTGVKFVESDDTEGPVEVEVEYDARLIALPQLSRVIERAGGCMSPSNAVVMLRIEGMSSPRAEPVVEARLAGLPGVKASASFVTGTLRVEFDRRSCAMPEIARRLAEIGVRIVGSLPTSTTTADDQPATLQVTAQPRRELVSRGMEFLAEYPGLATAIGGLVLLLAGWSVHLAGGPGWLRITLLLAAYVVAGWYTAIDTFGTLRQMRFDIDVLMFAAAFGAAALGHFEEGAFLLVLFAFGGAGEEIAMDKARRAINALAKLAPETAIVRAADGSQRTVRVEELLIGDEVVVRPFDRIAADGEVASGTSAVDQAPITGESVPVEKSAGEVVFAGTINGEGLLSIRVTKLASQSTLAKIIKLVNEAQSTKSPTQLFTDRVEKWYVPIVLVATMLLIFVPPLMHWGSWGTWFYRAMAFLTAASPCALAIGTPAAVLSGIAKAARIGVLVKGGAHLETLGRVRAIAFDKTGTLTRGKPAVVVVHPVGDIEGSRVIEVAAAVEQSSTHPLAKSIVAAAKAKGSSELLTGDVQQIPGKGLVATIENQRVSVGNASMLSPDQREIARPLIDQCEAAGQSTVVVAVDEKLIGVIGLADEPRASAKQTLVDLHALGIEHLVMLTGDNPAAAHAVGSNVGVDAIEASLLPEDKLNRIRALVEKYRHVAMIGDGVNDSPALAAASVGIAMGGAGSDVAIETADVALMSDDLSKLPDAIGLSRFSRKIIKQNLTISLGVIAFLAPAAALGFAKLGWAVLFHEGSTVLVVLNSLRILGYRRTR